MTEYTYTEACKLCKRGQVIVSVKYHNSYSVIKGTAKDDRGLIPYDEEIDGKWYVMDKKEQ